MDEVRAGTVSRLRLAILECDSFELAAKLTFLTPLSSPVGDWYIRPLILCLSAAGLLVPDLWRSRWLWTLLALLTTLRVWQDWILADNHAYLLAYCCLACAISAWLRDARVLALNAPADRAYIRLRCLAEVGLARLSQQRFFPEHLPAR